MNRPKIITAASLSGVLALLMAAPVVAQDSAADGQALYREYCKACHSAGSPNGEYTPMTLIGVQWERFFDRKFERTHKDVIDEQHGGKPVPEAIPEDILEVIRQFSIDHAADSESPMTCG